MDKPDIKSLIVKLKAGAMWIGQNLARGGHNPWTDREIERFEREVVAPLDAAWEKLNDTEKSCFVTQSKQL